MSTRRHDQGEAFLLDLWLQTRFGPDASDYRYLTIHLLLIRIKGLNSSHQIHARDISDAPPLRKLP